MARRGAFVRCEEAARWRRQCIDVLTRAKPQGELYRAVETLVDAIEVVAGNRRKFHQ